jgi:hypothetical protein
MRDVLAIPVLAALVAGCAGARGDWPVLQSRPVESVRLPDPDAPPPPRPVADVPSATVLADADRLLAEAEADLRAAQGALAGALAAARGQPFGSPAWSAAQVAHSRLWEGCGPVARLRDRLTPPLPAGEPALPPAPSAEAAQRIERADALLARCEASAAQARAALAQ